LAEIKAMWLLRPKRRAIAAVSSSVAIRMEHAQSVLEYDASRYRSTCCVIMVPARGAGALLTHLQLAPEIAVALPISFKAPETSDDCRSQ
jgi:hypothetical protein